MEYTYKGKDYPKDLNIKHQEVFTTLSKDPLDITRREFDHLFDIPTEEFCADEEQLILWELGKQWGKSAEQLESDTTVNQNQYTTGFVFLQGSTKFLQQYLYEHYPFLHLVKDHNTGVPAVIPDSQMQPFMQIIKDDPTPIRILLHPIEHYAEGNIKLRVLTGILKGQEGYLIRIARDRKLVMKIGDMVVAIGGIYKEELEEVQDLVNSSYQAMDNG